ncbi:MAG: exosortase/archaeosortase family protein [Verrucomicrobiae bacterium]|nr:exosortase/archaeosortase family protein [Verrucomicrobiae bacterium]
MESRFQWQQWVRKNRLGVVLLALIAGFVYYLYFVQIVNPYRHTTYTWLVGHWRMVSHYTHGPLIPLIALWLLWWKRAELLRAAVRPHNGGLPIVALAMLFYYLGLKGGQERLLVLSFVVLLYGLTLAVGGRELLRVAFFPITFLLLMIPLNFLEERVAVPLQHLMAICSTAVLNMLGVPAQRVGTGIYSSEFQFHVDTPCSGIQSLMALTTVTAAYAYVTLRQQWKRWALFLSAIPLAVLGNMARVILVALVAQVYGQNLAMQLHDTAAGYIVFAVALVLMVLFGLALEFPYRRWWDYWTKPIEPKQVPS